MLLGGCDGWNWDAGASNTLTHPSLKQIHGPVPVPDPRMWLGLVPSHWYPPALPEAPIPLQDWGFPGVPELPRDVSIRVCSLPHLHMHSLAGAECSFIKQRGQLALMRRVIPQRSIANGLGKQQNQHHNIPVSPWPQHPHWICTHSGAGTASSKIPTSLCLPNPFNPSTKQLQDGILRPAQSSIPAPPRVPAATTNPWMCVPSSGASLASNWLTLVCSIKQLCPRHLLTGPEARYVPGHCHYLLPHGAKNKHQQ